MVAELNIVTEWLPEQMEPGTIFVLENAGEVGDQEDPYWAVLSCPECGTLGLITRRQMRGVVEPHRGKAFVKALLKAAIPVGYFATQKIAPENEVFRGAQGRLQRVAVAEIMGLFAKVELGVAALQRDRSAGRDQKPRDQPKEGGLAGSVAAGDGQRAACRRLEIEAGKHLPATPHTPDAASQEPHFCAVTALRN